MWHHSWAILRRMMRSRTAFSCIFTLEDLLWVSGQEESHLYSMGNGDSNFALQNVSGDLRGISGVAWLGCRDDPSFVDFATRNSAKGKAGEKPVEEEPAVEHRFRWVCCLISLMSASWSCRGQRYQWAHAIGSAVTEIGVLYWVYHI